MVYLAEPHGSASPRLGCPAHVSADPVLTGGDMDPYVTAAR